MKTQNQNPHHPQQGDAASASPSLAGSNNPPPGEKQLAAAKDQESKPERRDSVAALKKKLDELQAALDEKKAKQKTKAKKLKDRLAYTYGHAVIEGGPAILGPVFASLPATEQKRVEELQSRLDSLTAELAA